MRRILITSISVLSLLITIVSPALATNPHFVNASASVGSNGALVITWKEAGLGDNVNVDYTASADASAVYGSVNNGQKHPKASNKETFAGPVSGSGSFNSGRNGAINGSLSLGPVVPAPGTFSCPPGQTVELISITYTNVVLTDVTNGISAPISPGPYTRVFFK